MRPILAADIESVDDVYRLKYPVLISEKLDGRRTLVLGGTPATRSLKPIPNHHIRNTLKSIFHCWPNFVFDGELRAGDTLFSTGSAYTRRAGHPVFTYHLFDCVINRDFNMSFEQRLLNLGVLTSNIKSSCIKYVPHYLCDTPDQVIAWEEELRNSGAEGIMIRSMRGPYKFGRSTFDEGYLLRWKYYKYAEARIVKFNELMHNGNEQFTNELGLTSRSSHQENLIPSGILGSIELDNGVTVGTFKGFTMKKRAEMWRNRKEYVNKVCKYKYRDYGIKDKPREVVLVEIL